MPSRSAWLPSPSTLFRVLVGVSGAACGAHGGSFAPPPLPTEAEWRDARAWLSALRETEPVTPFGAVVRVSLREPHTGHTFSARGAVAVDPHRAVRMILLGPAGATALDLWATPLHWRFEVPAVGIRRRGGLEDDATLPVGFFRWWFLAPVAGRLLTSAQAPSSQRFILRDDRATVDLTDAIPEGVEGGHVLTASRRALDSAAPVDRVEFHGAAFRVAPGDRATYDEDRSGVHVEVTVESPSGTPDPSAFVDPDAAPGAAGEGDAVPRAGSGA